MEKCKSRLQKTIDFLSENRKIHISLHDVVGVLSKSEALKLPYNYQINDCTFCNTAKSTFAGHHICMKLKSLSVKKCKREKELYTGKCYLGISQVVCPIIWKNELVCIIYVSNMINKNEIENFEKKTLMYERHTGIAHQTLTEQIKEIEKIDSCDKYIDAALMLRDVITSILNSENRKISEINTKHHIINSVINYCHQYYNSDISLRDLAKIYFIHPDYLCKLFKKEVGISFSNYVNNVRIKAAKMLLESTDKKITDIAFEVGYTSDTYFIKKFKEIMGVSPKQYSQIYVKHIN